MRERVGAGWRGLERAGVGWSGVERAGAERARVSAGLRCDLFAVSSHNDAIGLTLTWR